MRPQPSLVPTIVSADEPGCAQPLGHPDTCTVNEPSRRQPAVRLIRGPSARAGISAEAQMGAPGGFDQAIKRSRIGVPESETDAEAQTSIT